MNGVGAMCAAFSEMGIESGNHSRRPGPDTRLDDKGLLISESGGRDEFQGGLAGRNGNGKE
jgi:hypothetical protein